MQDEAEDWGRWRDVVFRAKAPLRPPHWELKPPPPKNKKRKGQSEFVDESMNTFRSGSASTATIESSPIPLSDTAEPVAQLPETPAESASVPVEEAVAQLSITEAVDRAREIAPQVAVPLVEAGQHYCPECYLPLHPDPKPEKLYIFLHALKYTTSLGAYETNMPEWSEPGWDWDRS